MATYQPFKQQLYQPPYITPLHSVLILDGFVNIPLTFSIQEFCKLPHQQVSSVITCSDNQQLYEGRWRAVPLSILIERVQPTSVTRFVQFIGADGYTTCLAWEDAQEALIATHQNGEPLTDEQGGRYRLVLEGRYGYKLPKWLTHIYFMETPTLGFWEQRGANAVGLATPRSTLDTVHIQENYIELSGTAWGGSSTLQTVVITLDGVACQATQLIRENASTLHRWSLALQPTQHRAIHVRVCAVNTAGEHEPHISQPQQLVRL